MDKYRESQPDPEHSRFLFVDSNIESIERQNSPIKVELGPDGKAKAAAFFDIDGTLAHLKFAHYGAIREMYPDVDPEEVTRVFESGWKLGNSFREQHRMHGIYAEGRKEWKDPEVFYKEEFLPKQEQIDTEGFFEHDRAALLVRQYDQAAIRALDKVYEENPKVFESVKIQPIFHLAELYKRLGIPMAVMTANPSGLTRAFAKHLGFAEMFIDLATDETMVGGGKERAITYLVGQMEAKGISVPKDRLILIGDSFRGDVGVGTKLPKEWEAKAKGLVVLENEEALAQLQQQIVADAEMARIASEIDVSGLVVDQVSVDKNGKPILSSRYRDKFLTKL